MQLLAAHKEPTDEHVYNGHYMTAHFRTLEVRCSVCKETAFMSSHNCHCDMENRTDFGLTVQPVQHESGEKDAMQPQHKCKSSVT
jgi:hypothetical protein